MWLDALRAALPEDVVLLPFKDVVDKDKVEVAAVAGPVWGAFRGFDHLRLVQSLWAGAELLAIDDSIPASVPICRVVDPNQWRPWLARSCITASQYICGLRSIVSYRAGESGTRILRRDCENTGLCLSGSAISVQRRSLRFSL